MRILLLSLSLLLISCTTKTDSETVVGIKAYNGFPKEKTNLIAETIADFYGVRTILLDEKTISKKAKYHCHPYRRYGLFRYRLFWF